MKRFFITALITILALSSLKANAACMSSAQIKSAVEKQVLATYRQYTDAQLHVEVVALPFKELDIPNGEVKFKVSSHSEKFMPRELEKVEVYVNGDFYRTFNTPIIVKAYKDVLVASTSIGRDRLLDSNVLRVERREVSNNIDSVLTAKDLNKEIIAKKFFVEGELIDKRFVKLKPEITRNSVVTVLFNTNNLTITVDGTALSEGSTGDDICIMNKNFNKIYKGTVIGQNKVLVKI